MKKKMKTKLTDKQAVKKEKKLTARQDKFCDEYIIHLEGKKAAINAGFSPKYADRIAYQLLENPRVKEEIKKRQEKLQKKTEITQDWVINNLKKVFERCMQEEAVTDREGNFEGIFKFESSGANKSLELLGKHLGMFADKLKLSNDGDKPFQVETKTKITVEVINQTIDNLIK